jgi:hypothetical protein
MYTCPTELAAVLPSIETDRMINVCRHVAWDVATDFTGACDLIGAPVKWIAGSYDSADCWGELTLENVDELYRACESAAYIRAIDSAGNRATPTFSLA